MRVALLGALLSLGTMFSLPLQIQAQAAGQELPVSMDRIRASLNGRRLSR
jgi:hypothetical protein